MAPLTPCVPLRHWIVTVPASGAWSERPSPDAWAQRAVVAALFDVFRKTTTGEQGRERARCGAVTVALRRGSAEGRQLHLHALMLDGVCLARPASLDVPLVFLPHAAAPDVARVAAAVATRLPRPRAARELRVEHTPVGGPAVAPQPAGRGAHAGREGTVRFDFPFALSNGASGTELAPAEIARRLGHRLGGQVRRIRFHGILARGGGRGVVGAGPQASTSATLALLVPSLRRTGS